MLIVNNISFLGTYQDFQEMGPLTSFKDDVWQEENEYPFATSWPSKQYKLNANIP